MTSNTDLTASHLTASQLTAAQHTAAHLTQAQLDDALIGDLAAAAQAHLDDCPVCTAALAAERFPLQSLQAISLAWGERRSATMAPVVAPTRRTPQLGVRIAWTTAAAAALALAVGIPALHRATPDHSAAPPAAAPVAVASLTPDEMNTPSAATGPTGLRSVHESTDDAQIDRDNQMLRAIDREFDASSDSPAALGLQPAEAQPAPTPIRSVQD